MAINSKCKVDMSKEIWKPVVGYEGSYEVSNYGRMRSVERRARFVSKSGKESWRVVRPKAISCTVGKKSNRVSVMLSKGGKRKRIALHRIVAFAFVENENPSEYTEINHIDENPRNNRADNLEWCNRQYNMTYGKMKEMYRMKCRPVISYDGAKETYYESVKDAYLSIGCKRYQLMYALKYGAKLKGCTWRYADGKQQSERKKWRIEPCS